MFRAKLYLVSTLCSTAGYGAKYGGQNIGFSSRSGDDDSGDWKTAISRWFSEVKYFKFGAGSIDPKHKVGDYAQVQ